MIYDLKIIKKKYGEKFSHLCRDLFPTILEEEGLLSKIILDNFHESHLLYDDIVGNELVDVFKNFIYAIYNSADKNGVKVMKTPSELLEEAGYWLFECNTEEDIQKFRKYYAKGEELCTFNGQRLYSCYVFFAVKKNVDEIKRCDFKKPDRQDLYGTSVISIQFSRNDNHTLSIKNRYNHKVNNPDATFSNNLDNIVGGLTDSFAKHYGMVQKNSDNYFEIPCYVKACDNKYYRYNCEINNIYYCVNNVIIDNFKVKKFDKSRYLVFEYFIIDKFNKKIYLYDNNLNDSFVDCISNISSIDIINVNGGKKVTIIRNNTNKLELYIDKYNKLIKVFSDYIENVGDYFLYKCEYITNLTLTNLKTVGSYFMNKNFCLNELNLPKLEVVGNDFLDFNKNIGELSFPNLKVVGDNFLGFFTCLTSLNVPNLEFVGNDFMKLSSSIKSINFFNLKIVGDNFFYCGYELTEFNAPRLKVVGNNFLYLNRELKKLSLPCLEEVGSGFLSDNLVLKEASFKKLKQVGYGFMYNNILLEKIEVPNLMFVGNNFLINNGHLKKLEVPNLLVVGDSFLQKNEILEDIDLSSLEIVGDYFLYNNKRLEYLNLPNLNKNGINNNKIKKLVIIK